jgi:outer membrane lipoprotein carrier protein
MLGVLIVGVLTTASAGTTTNILDRFFQEFRTLRADFSQEVLDENLVPLEQSTGRLWISRPGKFRWDYHPPFALQIIADGARIWMYDVELEQVTVRNQDRALDRTPALLLAGQGDVRLDYTIKNLARQGSVDWISLQPKEGGGSFTEVQLGFQNGTLRLIQLLDNLDQITRIVLSHVEENPQIPASQFRFTVPAGVDLIEGGL